MIEWNEQHLMIRDMMRRFIDAEIARGGSRHDIVALARIETLLQVIEEERARLARDAGETR